MIDLDQIVYLRCLHCDDVAGPGSKNCISCECHLTTAPHVPCTACPDEGRCGVCFCIRFVPVASQLVEELRTARRVLAALRAVLEAELLAHRTGFESTSRLVADLRRDRAQLRAALGEALDNWDPELSPDDDPRIAELRKLVTP